MTGPILMALYTFEHRSLWILGVVAMCIAATATAWVIWRRSGARSRLAAIAFTLAATCTVMFGDGVLYYGVIWAACVVLGVTFAARWAVWLYTTALVVSVSVLHITSGSSDERILVEVIGTLFLCGIGAAVAGTLRESLHTSDMLRRTVGELDDAQQELRERHAADRDLVVARERERTARELHDVLGHRLTAIGLAIDYAARVDDDRGARELARARGLVSESLEAMRRIVRAMHPVELGSLGDGEAFEAIAVAFRGTGITIDVQVEGHHRRLRHEHALLLLRFAQEGLTNIVRHTDATAAALHVVIDENDVRATLTDDGRPPHAGAIEEGFGLRSLRQRSAELGGDFAAEATTDGFTLTVVLPDAVDSPTPRSQGAVA